MFYWRPHQDQSEPDQDKERETEHTPEQVALCTDSACSCELRGGCLETPPVVPPTEAPPVSSQRNAATRPMPTGCA